jgi:hypothetical protein
MPDTKKSSSGAPTDFFEGIGKILDTSDRVSTKELRGLPKLAAEGAENVLNQAFAHIGKVGVARSGSLLSGIGDLSNSLSQLMGTKPNSGMSEDSLMTQVVDGMDSVSAELPDTSGINDANERMNPFPQPRVPSRTRGLGMGSASMTGPIGRARPQLSRVLPSPAPAGVAPSTPAPAVAAPPPAAPPPSMPSGPPPPMPGGPTAPGQISAINPPAPVRSPILASTAGKAPVKVEDVNRAPGQGKFDTLEFNEAFKIAKGAGLTEFVWRERRYSTKV